MTNFPMPSDLIIRPTTLADLTLLWVWRNDAETRRMERDPAILPRAGYCRELKRQLADPAYCLLIAETQTSAVAGATLRRNGAGAARGAEIGIIVDPAWRGRGLASRLIRAFIGHARPALGFVTVFAQIRAENMASYLAFASAGFTLWAEQRMPEPDNRVILTYRFDCQAACAPDAPDPRPRH